MSKRFLLLGALLAFCAALFADEGYVSSLPDPGHDPQRYELGMRALKDGNNEEAVYWFRKAARRGYAAAQYRLAVCYDRGWGVKKDLPEAVKWYKEAADSYEGNACYELGMCYYEGRGVRQDFKLAAEYFARAAGEGVTEGEFMLGVCCLNGEGTAQDRQRALKIFRKFAAQGHAGAQFKLGACYAEGNGVPQDWDEAAKYYRQAAERGVKEAQFRLAQCLENGDGVTKDLKQAVEWYRKAAAQGHPEAQYDLGRCHENGIGVAKNLDEAVKWYLKAAAQGHPEARKKVKDLEFKIKKPERFEVELSGNVKLDLVRVEKGTFTIGKRDGENYDDENEHQATMTRDFYIGKTEVTQAQYKAVMGTNPSKFKGDDLPVEQVSWNDAMAFCKKLNDMGKAPEGWKFTLPTEAQWEFAARGGKKSRGYKYSGSDDLDEVAWYRDNSGYGTLPVASKKANELGLYDMSGNVAEWCRDWYEEGYARDPEFLTGNSGSYRTYRGGSYSSEDRECRLACRSFNDPEYRFSDLGFRLALVRVE